MIPTIVTFKWTQPGSTRVFKPEYVKVLHNSLKRNLTIPFNFVCVTDDPRGLKGIKTHPLWPSPCELTNASRPNCYRRLFLFSEEAKSLFGERIVCLDLDIVITKNLDHVFRMEDDFIGYNKGSTPIQGAFFSLRAGSRKEVWERFDCETSPALGKKWPGSDQAWMSYMLKDRNEKVLRRKDGFYCYDLDRLNRRPLPDDCSLVFFRGGIKPWNSKVRKLAWVKRHWRE